MINTLSTMETVALEANSDGVILVGKTRVTLDTVVEAFKEGATAEEIIYQYPSLRLADVYSVIAYYLNHQAEIEAYLIQRREQYEKVKSKIESQLSQVGIRERLLARKKRANEIAGR
jgi:uncharacterized protein (DUF433 family)